MKTRAAVAFRKPSSRSRLSSLISKAPKPAKCWSKSWRPASVTPTPTRSMGSTAKASSPACSAMKARAWCAKSARASPRSYPGDHVIPLYTPECRQCKMCLSGKTNLCSAIRATQGQGVMPDGTSRFSYKGETIYHYMGCSTFSNFTVLPEIAVAKIRTDAPFESACYVGCGVTTGVGAVVNTAKVEPGDNVVVFGLGGIGLNVIQGAEDGGRRPDCRRRHQPGETRMGRAFGMTDFVNPKETANVVDHLVELLDGGADYSFDCTGNTDVMRDALECCHKGWGTSIIIGVAEAGKEIATRPFQLVTGRNWRGTAFGGAKGRTDVPKIVDWYMNGKIAIDPMITHRLTLEEINTGFDLMHAGESIRSVVVY